MIIHCFHPSELAAGELAELVFAQMMSARHTIGDGIRDVTVVGSPARFDDPTTAPRFK